MARARQLGHHGLAQPWFGKVFLNPPYSATGRWLTKARAEVAEGNAELVVCLVPASVGTRLWREHAPGASLVRFWPGRITFGAAEHHAGFDSAVLVFGTLTGHHGTVPKMCAHCNRVFFPAQRNRITCSERCRRQRSRLYYSRGSSICGRAAAQRDARLVT